MNPGNNQTKPKTVAVILGTRPEAIKLAPVIEQLKKRSDTFDTKIIVTAQHRQMTDQVLDLFQIKPDYDLNIMTRNQSLYKVTSEILKRMKNVLPQIKPNIVLVQGDTTTTFAGSLAAFYEQIPIGHIEAGLRTTNRYYPFPEEINRRLVSVLSVFHFAPTQRAAMNLKKEGIPQKNIFVTGNTIVDSLHKALERGVKHPSLPFSIDNQKIVLVTAHRRENFGDRLKIICHSIQRLVRADRDIQVVYPVHLNPSVQKVVLKRLSHHERIHLCKPWDYQTTVSMMSCAKLILTDSGGIQEEAPSFGVPVVVLREETERLEGLDSGLVAIAGLDPDRILKESLRFLNLPLPKREDIKNPYGDGKASKRIVDILFDLSQKGYF